MSLARCIEQIEGASAPFEMCPGVLETRWYAQLGIPAFAYGGGRLDVSHGPIDEAAMRRCLRALRPRGTAVIPGVGGSCRTLTASGLIEVGDHLRFAQDAKTRELTREAPSSSAP